MEEIFKGISLENWSWGKNFKGDFFYNWLRMKVKVKVKSEKSEWVFGPLIFFNLRYIKGGVKGKQQHRYKKVHNNFLVGLIFWRSWRNFQEFSKSQCYGDFLENILESGILEKIVKGFTWKKWRFFFSKIFT